MINNVKDFLIEEVLPPMLIVSGVVIFIFSLLGIIAGIFVALGFEDQGTKYFNQCVADGHKEYECYSMIYGKGK